MLWLIPLVATLTSVVFFRSSPDDQSLVGRVLVSAHGVTIAAFFVGAMSVYWSNLSRADFAIPFCIGLLLPVALMIFSFFKFRGPRTVQWLQLLNLSCLALTFIIGGMGITGDFP
jgi:hypothetical protein